MSTDPWTNPEPARGDFDADLTTLDPRYVEHNEDEVLSPAEASRRLGFSRQHVMRLVSAGELDGERLPGSSYWKIPLASILAFEERREAAHERADAFSRELDQLGVPLE